VRNVQCLAELCCEATQEAREGSIIECHDAFLVMLRLVVHALLVPAH
jgi:hypothetical protein